MRKERFIILVIAVLFVSCTNSNPGNLSIEKVQNTKWRLEIADGCISTLNFMEDQKYTAYNCEMEDTLFGTYELADNDLVLLQVGSVSDILYKPDSPHRIGKAKFILSLDKGALRFVHREDYVDGRWDKSEITFPEDYIYEKY